MTKKLIVTGASGLIGGEVVDYFSKRGWKVIGIDNNFRKVFFGEDGDTTSNMRRLEEIHNSYKCHTIDIRDRNSIDWLFMNELPDAVVHCAAQPSHDKAAKIAHLDFETNALGTLNLLEATRKWSRESPFVFLSTNKVYGDRPNSIELVELETRWDYSKSSGLQINGINESMSIDQCTHSLFGVSKASADLLVQEYGRYFGLQTCCLRGGCLTGPTHSGVELHGFLNYLIKCNLESRKYIVYGYKGKQVRDNIHSVDVASFIYSFAKNPKPGAVYNIGGGYENSISIIESFRLIESITGREMIYEYNNDNRIGDHICYYSDLGRIKEDYPEWQITQSIEDIFRSISSSYISKL